MCLDNGASHFDFHSHGNRRREKQGGSTSNCKLQPGKRHMLPFALHKVTVTWPGLTLQVGSVLLCKLGNRKDFLPSQEIEYVSVRYKAMTSALDLVPIDCAFNIHINLPLMRFFIGKYFSSRINKLQFRILSQIL